jgi:acetylornithine/succinyldiaminopimelate/putrescine aminotransferase
VAEMGGILQLASGKITHNERASGKDIIDAVVNAVFNCVKEDSTLMGFSMSSSGIKSISSKTLKKNRELTTARGKGLLLAARKRRPSI